MSQTTPPRTRASQNKKRQSNPADGSGNENTSHQKRTGGTSGRPRKRADRVLRTVANEDVRADNQGLEVHTRTNENDVLLGAYMGRSRWRITANPFCFPLAEIAALKQANEAAEKSLAEFREAERESTRAKKMEVDVLEKPPGEAGDLKKGFRLRPAMKMEGGEHDDEYRQILVSFSFD